MGLAEADTGLFSCVAALNAKQSVAPWVSCIEKNTREFCCRHISEFFNKIGDEETLGSGHEGDAPLRGDRCSAGSCFFLSRYIYPRWRHRHCWHSEL